MDILSWMASDALILGGGYPENYAAGLALNEAMREEIGAAARAGMPMLAECGGFLYLHRTLEGSDGKDYPMAGAVDAVEEGSAEARLEEAQPVEAEHREDGNSPYILYGL